MQSILEISSPISSWIKEETNITPNIINNNTKNNRNTNLNTFYLYFTNKYYILYDNQWKLLNCFEIIKGEVKNDKDDVNIHEYYGKNINPIQLIQSNNIKYNKIEGEFNEENNILSLHEKQIHFRMKNI
jgi:hypothetical protein